MEAEAGPSSDSKPGEEFLGAFQLAFYYKDSLREIRKLHMFISSSIWNGIILFLTQYSVQMHVTVTTYCYILCRKYANRFLSEKIGLGSSSYPTRSWSTTP